MGIGEVQEELKVVNFYIETIQGIIQKGVPSEQEDELEYQLNILKKRKAKLEDRLGV